MAKSVFHIVPSEDQWAVKREGNGKPSSKHPTQQESIDAARDLASEGDELVIHRSDGTIRDRITYTGGRNGNGSNGHAGPSTSTKANEIPASDVLSVGTRVSWGAIMAGALVGLTVYITLLFLALAIGVTTIDDIQGRAFAIGAAIVGVFSLLAALFVGGMVTSATTVGETKTEVLIYGILVWATFLGLMILLGTFGGIGFGTVLHFQDSANLQSVTAEDFTEMKGITQEHIKAFNEVVQEKQKILSQAGAPAKAWIGFAGLILSIFAAMGGALVGAGPEMVLKRIQGRRRLVVKS